jgi:3-methyladenine DNA glycosylase AlkD
MTKASLAYELILAEMNNNAIPDKAAGMKKYMKNHFEFLGVPAPLRKTAQTPIFKELPKDIGFIKELTLLLWQSDYREIQYVAMDLLDRNKNLLSAEEIDFIIELISNKSWWDTVDLLASKLIGHILKPNPVLTEELCRQWNQSDNMWVVRTAILAQLNFKQKTNESLLYELILDNNSSKEFFIQKAMGWTLRNYARVNPVSVTDFLIEHREFLPKLTFREGSKYLDL